MQMKIKEILSPNCKNVIDFYFFILYCFGPYQFSVMHVYDTIIRKRRYFKREKILFKTSSFLITFYSSWSLQGKFLFQC